MKNINHILGKLVNYYTSVSCESFEQLTFFCRRNSDKKIFKINIALTNLEELPKNKDDIIL